MKVRMKSEERRAAIVRSAIHLVRGEGVSRRYDPGTGGGGRRDRTGAVPALPHQERSLQRDYRGQGRGGFRTRRRTAATGAIGRRPGVFRHARRTSSCGATRRTRSSAGCCSSVRWNATNCPTCSSSGCTRAFISWSPATYAAASARADFCKVNAEIAARGLIGMISYHGLVALLFPGRFKVSNRRRIVDEMVSVFL